MLVSIRQWWSRTHVNDAHFNVCIDENVISDTDCIDYLGIKIDNNLSWSNQIDSLCKELRAKVGLFSRLTHFLSVETLLKIYNGIIQPKFDY